MQNLKFNKSMISSIEDFKKYLSPKQIRQFEERLNLIEFATESYGIKPDKVVFYKNPYLFTLEGQSEYTYIMCKTEANKCFITVVNESLGREEKCILNFTTKRYLRLQ